MLDMFANTGYTFQVMSNGLVTSEYSALGVFKERVGITNDGRHDSHDVTSSLHIYPTESFIDTVGGYIGLEGHGIQIGTNTYRIDGVSNGTDLVGDGQSEFYRLTLTKRANAWQSDLPLS